MAHNANATTLVENGLKGYFRTPTLGTCLGHIPGDKLFKEMLVKPDDTYPDFVPRRIAAFHSAFLDQIRTHGRVFEFGLVASYKMRSGVLFADVDSVPGMLARGKLALTPKRIRGLQELRKIFDQCATEKTR